MKSAKTIGVAIAIAAMAVTSVSAAELGRPAPASEWAPGTWQLVSRLIHEDNPYANPFDNSPSGLKLIHADGRFVMMIKRPHRHPAQAVRIGGRGKPLLADTAYGTWSVDEEARTITFHIEMSTFPSWVGKETRVYSLRGDRWSYFDPNPKDGEDNTYLDWKRLN
jgi:hypothetical protein